LTAPFSRTAEVSDRVHRRSRSGHCGPWDAAPHLVSTPGSLSGNSRFFYRNMGTARHGAAYLLDKCFRQIPSGQGTYMVGEGVPPGGKTRIVRLGQNHLDSTASHGVDMAVSTEQACHIPFRIWAQIIRASAVTGTGAFERGSVIFPSIHRRRSRLTREKFFAVVADGFGLRRAFRDHIRFLSGEELGTGGRSGGIGFIIDAASLEQTKSDSSRLRMLRSARTRPFGGDFGRF